MELTLLNSLNFLATPNSLSAVALFSRVFEMQDIEFIYWSKKIYEHIAKESATTMDWVKWHEEYQVSPALKARLQIVREHLSLCLDAQPPGPIRVVSICAGDARDLIGLMAVHPRRTDVNAFLIENNPELAENGRKTIVEAGFEQQLKFIVADATLSSTYLGLIPADIILMAGVFGNLLSEDVANLIHSLCFFCKSNGFVVWTRHRHINFGPSAISNIRELFTTSGFKEIRIDYTADNSFMIGTDRYHDTVQPLPAGEKLFCFTGFDKV